MVLLFLCFFWAFRAPLTALACECDCWSLFNIAQPPWAAKQTSAARPHLSPFRWRCRCGCVSLCFHRQTSRRRTCGCDLLGSWDWEGCPWCCLSGASLTCRHALCWATQPQSGAAAAAWWASCSFWRRNSTPCKDDVMELTLNDMTHWVIFSCCWGQIIDERWVEAMVCLSGHTTHSLRLSELQTYPYTPQTVTPTWFILLLLLLYYCFCLTSL